MACSGFRVVFIGRIVLTSIGSTVLSQSVNFVQYGCDPLEWSIQRVLEFFSKGVISSLYDMIETITLWSVG